MRRFHVPTILFLVPLPFAAPPTATAQADLVPDPARATVYEAGDARGTASEVVVFAAGRNAGSAGCGASTAEVELALADGPRRVARLAVPPLSAGEPWQASAVFGSCSVDRVDGATVRMDADAAVAESDETNNSLWLGRDAWWPLVHSSGFEPSAAPWRMSEELVKGKEEEYVAGAGHIESVEGIGVGGGPGLLVQANVAGTKNSNLVLAWTQIADHAVDGVYHMQFAMRVPDRPDQEGQAVVFTMQNTSRTPRGPDATETRAAGFLYSQNSFDPGWRIFVENAWEPFAPLDPLPELPPGHWYEIEFVVDLTSNRYRALAIRSLDDPLFVPVSRRLDQVVPAHFKRFEEESFVISVEAENQWTDPEQPGGRTVTRFEVVYDEVALRRAVRVVDQTAAFVVPGLGVGETRPNDPAGSGMAVGDLDANGRPDLVLAAVDVRAGAADRLGYRVGLNLHEETGRPWHAAPSWRGEPVWSPDGLSQDTVGAGAALADLDGNGRPDLVLVVRQADGWFRVHVARDLDRWGVPTSWSVGPAVPGVSSGGGAADADGAGLAAADLDADGTTDLVLASYEQSAASGALVHRYRVAYGVAADGTYDRLGDVVEVEGEGRAQGAGACLVDLDGSGTPELVLSSYDNGFRYRVGWNVGADGRAVAWSRGPDVPGLGSQAEGAGVAGLSLDGDRRGDLLLMTCDVGFGANGWNEFRLRTERNAFGHVDAVPGGAGCGFEPSTAAPRVEARVAPTLDGGATLYRSGVPAGMLGVCMVSGTLDPVGWPLLGSLRPGCVVSLPMHAVSLPFHAGGFVQLPPVLDGSALYTQSTFTDGVRTGLTAPLALRFGLHAQTAR